MKYNILSHKTIDQSLINIAEQYLRLSLNSQGAGFIKEKKNRTRDRSVFLFVYENQKYFCKKYLNKSRYKKKQDLIRKSRAERSFLISDYLTNNSIQTANHVLAMYDNIGKSSVFITKECLGSTLKEIFSKQIITGEKSLYIHKLKELFIKLIFLNVFHRDLNFDNIIISESKEFRLIDMDDIKIIKHFKLFNLFRYIEKFNRVLLLEYTRVKKLNFKNNDRVDIIKFIIERYYGKSFSGVIFKLINLYTRYKMQRFLIKTDGENKYLNEGTIQDVNKFLFSS